MQATKNYRFWHDVILGYLDRERAAHRDDHEYVERLRYIEKICYHGNSEGRHNPHLTLPWPTFAVEDIEELFGIKPSSASSAGAWKAIRAHYDASNAGGGLSL